MILFPPEMLMEEEGVKDRICSHAPLDLSTTLSDSQSVVTGVSSSLQLPKDRASTLRNRNRPMAVGLKFIFFDFE